MPYHAAADQRLDGRPGDGQYGRFFWMGSQVFLRTPEGNVPFLKFNIVDDHNMTFESPDNIDDFSFKLTCEGKYIRVDRDADPVFWLKLPTDVLGYDMEAFARRAYENGDAEDGDDIELDIQSV